MDFSRYPASGRYYTGAERKKGILKNGETYIVKYAKDSPEGKTFSHVSEYLGSHLFEHAGLETQQTMLGTCGGCDVVVMKDVISEQETFVPFNAVGDSSLEQDREPYTYGYEDIIRMLQENEYTTPITEVPSYRNSGIIKAVTEDGEKIQVGRITYESFENEEFQYIITPFWEIIDTLSADVFQGIPGIDMDWRAAVDNLIVERARDEKKSDYADALKALESLLLESQYGDEITIASIEVLGSNSEECTKQLNRLMHYGVHLISKAEGVDATLLKETIRRFQKGEIELAEALRITGLSKSTLYRRIREM